MRFAPDTPYLITTWLVGFGLLGFVLSALKSACYWAFRQGVRNHWILSGTLISAALGPLGLFMVLVVPFPRYTYVPMPDIDTNFVKGCRWWALFNQVAYCSDYAKALMWLLNPGIPEDFGFHPEAQHPIAHRQSYAQWLQEWRVNLKRLVLLREMERQYVLDRFWTNFLWALRTPTGFLLGCSILSPILLDALDGFKGSSLVFRWLFGGGLLHL